MSAIAQTRHSQNSAARPGASPAVTLSSTPSQPETGLAMATVQKAIKRLEQENYVFAVSGRGTFVMPRK